MNFMEAPFTMTFDAFWRWLNAHPNCILRAGTMNAVLYDDEDLHWHFASEPDGTLLVQVLRGKLLLGELFVKSEEIRYVQAVAGESNEENLFELVIESDVGPAASYFFVPDPWVRGAESLLTRQGPLNPGHSSPASRRVSESKSELSPYSSENPVALLPPTIAALTPRDGAGHQFVCYADSCSGVAGAPEEAAFARVNAVLARLRPQPQFICFPGDEIIGLSTDEETSAKSMALLVRAGKCTGWTGTRIPLYHTTGNHTAYDPASERVFTEVLAHLPRNGPPGQEGIDLFHTPGRSTSRLRQHPLVRTRRRRARGKHVARSNPVGPCRCRVPTRISAIIQSIRSKGISVLMSWESCPKTAVNSGKCWCDNVCWRTSAVTF